MTTPYGELASDQVKVGLAHLYAGKYDAAQAYFQAVQALCAHETMELVRLTVERSLDVSDAPVVAPRTFKRGDTQLESLKRVSDNRGYLWRYAPRIRQWEREDRVMECTWEEMLHRHGPVTEV